MTEPEEIVPPLGSVQQFTEEDIDNRIKAILAQTQAQMQESHKRDMDDLRAQHVAEMDALRKALAGALPTSTVPEHAGGIGTEVAQTWSLWDQTLAKLGKHPLQLVVDAAEVASEVL